MTTKSQNVLITFPLLFSFLFSLKLIALIFVFFITNINPDSLVELYKTFQYN